MINKFILLLWIFLLVSLGAGEEQIYLAKVDGTINEGVAKYLGRVIEEGNREKTDLIVIKLDTEGGLIKGTQSIVRNILDSKVKVAVFVHKSGGWAYSAGTYILISSDIAVVNPQASIGAAMPVPPENKTTKAMESWISTLAEENKRNATIAKKFVSENLALSGEEALEKGVIEYTAKNLPELFKKLNFEKPKVKEIKPSFQEDFFSLLSHPQIVSLLFLIGVLGIIFELQTPGIGPGVIGTICLLLGLWGLGTIEFSLMGILLILVGIALLIAEFLQPGFGVFGISGTIAIFLGILTIDAEPFFTPKITDSITMFVFGVSLCMIIFFIIVTRGVVKSFREKVKTGPEALIGKRGKVIEELNPRGMVKVNSEIWSGISADKNTIKKGKEVKILKVEGNLLIVEKRPL
jgi:membrane-bound serine protease (ClpP class)